MITLKTLPNATAQEVFDQVARHLSTQGKKSKNEHGCRYRAGELKCAAGCLIADDEYSDDLEFNYWIELVEAGTVPDNHNDLILRLQRVHDSHPVEEWGEQLQRVANEWGLDYK